MWKHAFQRSYPFNQSLIIINTKLTHLATSLIFKDLKYVFSPESAGQFREQCWGPSNYNILNFVFVIQTVQNFFDTHVGASRSVPLRIFDAY